MGIRVDGASDLISASDGTLTIEGQSVNTTGIVTASGGVKVGTAATIHSTGQFNIGVAATIFANGNSTFAGIITATGNINATGNLTGAQGHFTDHIYIADKIVHTGDTNSWFRFPSNDQIALGTAGNEQFRVDSNGKLLAGTASARNVAGGSAKLQVEATSSEGISLTRTTDDAGASYLSFGKTRSGSVCQSGDTIGVLSWNPDDGTDLNHASAEISTEVATGIGGNDVPGHLIFKTNGGTTTTTERLRIKSTGKVGINTTATSSLLQLYGGQDGEGTAKGQITIKDTAAYNGSPQAGIVFQIHHASNNAQAIVAGIRGLKANAADGDYDGCLAFDTRKHGGVAFEAGRFDEDGNFTVNDGNVVVGTGGKGIDFSAQTATSASGASMSAELLDHYEEGSFTAKAYEGGSAITMTYNNTHGRYTRVGNMVTVWMWIRASGTTTSTGGMQVGGLPFASNADSYRPTLCGRAYGLQNFSGKSGLNFWMNGSSSVIEVVTIDGNGLAEASNTSNNVWQSGSEVHCTFSYFV